MQENLVIVESPAKAKTIEKFLGKDYVVKSSYGHIRDLAKKDLGIDIEHGFVPNYEVSTDKKKVVQELTKAVKGAKTVWLASDEDREGEAIAWHLAETLKLPAENTNRIVFHEITKNAIQNAINNPRRIDMNLVNSQQARRILDRLVGFELSPLLWRKIKPSLSAGRVQSVAVRLIVEREREIIDFKTTSFYRVTAMFTNPEDKKGIVFKAELNKRFDTYEQAAAFLNNCRGAVYTVSSSEKKPGKRNPSPPFTTSTLQQEAGRKLGMSVAQTMSVAQRLYESGLITYMRTDSVNLSKEAIGAAKKEIIARFGENYSESRNYTTKTKGAQEAHEAIRPSYFDMAAIEGTAQEKKLYDLIWKRAVASQMKSALIEKTVVEINVSTAREIFTATGEIIDFDGFLKLYIESSDDENQDDDNIKLPVLNSGDRLNANEVQATERFTQHPPRYSEASLVKKLEELGIGRPSTYAPTISTIINRGYVIKDNREGIDREYNTISLTDGKLSEKKLKEVTGREKNKLSPTDIGMVVNDYLLQQFKDIMDYNFTANVEKEFDDIAEGNKKWEEMIRSFYGPFHSSVDTALNTLTQVTSKPRVLGKDPKTGREVSARIGRYGPIVQIEGETQEDKPRYASLKKGQLIATITLEEALSLFDLPRNLGQYEGEEVVIGIGRFGPYVRYQGKFTSLPKTEDPYTITLDKAMELVRAKEQKDKDAKTPIKVFGDNEEIKIMKGRYGPYIASDGVNTPIPKSIDPAEITLDQVRELVEKGKQKKPRTKKK